MRPTRAVPRFLHAVAGHSPRVQVSEMQRARPLSAAVVTVEELGWSGASVAHITARTRVSTHVLRPVREPRRLPAGGARRGQSSASSASSPSHTSPSCRGASASAPACGRFSVSWIASRCSHAYVSRRRSKADRGCSRGASRTVSSVPSRPAYSRSGRKHVRRRERPHRAGPLARGADAPHISHRARAGDDRRAPRGQQPRRRRAGWSSRLGPDIEAASAPGAPRARRQHRRRAQQGRVQHLEPHSARPVRHRAPQRRRSAERGMTTVVFTGSDCGLLPFAARGKGQVAVPRSSSRTAARHSPTSCSYSRQTNGERTSVSTWTARRTSKKALRTPASKRSPTLPSRASKQTYPKDRTPSWQQRGTSARATLQSRRHSWVRTAPRSTRTHPSRSPDAQGQGPHPRAETRARPEGMPQEAKGRQAPSLRTHRPQEIRADH